MTRTQRSILITLLCVAAVIGPGAIAVALWSTSATGTLSVSVASPSASASAPSAPASLRCGGLDTPGNVRTVLWDTALGATSYEFYRVTSSTTVRPSPSVSPTPFVTISPIASPSATAQSTSFNKTRFDNSTYNWVSVRAVNASGSSAGSNEIRIDRLPSSYDCTTPTP